MKKIIWLVLSILTLMTFAAAQETPENNGNVNPSASHDLTLDELRAAKNIAKEFRQRCQEKLDLDFALKGLAVEDWQQRSAQADSWSFSSMLQKDLPDEEVDKLKHHLDFGKLYSTYLTLGFQGGLYTAIIDKPEKSEWDFPEEITAIGDLLFFEDAYDNRIQKINSVDRLRRVLFAHNQAMEITANALEHLKMQNPIKYEYELNKIFQMREERINLTVLDEEEAGLKKGTRVIYITVFPFIMAIAKLEGIYKIGAITFYSE